MTTERLNVSDNVGFTVTKGDGVIIESPTVPVETPEEPKSQELVEHTAQLRIFKPIKEYLDNQIETMKLDPVEVYSSLIHDAFRLHFHRMCPYCGEDKISWLKESKFKHDLARKLKRLKEKRIKKAQKNARKRNRG